MPPTQSFSFLSSPPPSPSSPTYSSKFDDIPYPAAHRPSRTRKHRSSSASTRQFIPADPSAKSSSSSNFILPGKRGKVTRLVLMAIILFPPISIFLFAMIPFILLVTVVFTYSIAWLLYWIMAGPITFSTLLLSPRRVFKINRVVFSVIFSNITLIPIGISLARYRFWTMRGSPDLITDVHYNQKRPANKLDIYIPSAHQTEDSHLLQNNLGKDALRPVIVFIYGGAWSSGSKFIYTLFGARLRSMGYLVMIPEYSIFPGGTIEDMEQDVKMAILWAYKNCRDFGGDPQQIYLMGHSAGAHLCAQAVLNDSIQRIPVSLFGSSSSAISSSPILSTLFSEPINQNEVLPRLRGMILCSGVYDIGEHYKHETSRGVEQISAMGRVMGNSEATFRLNSPTNVLQELLQVSTTIDRNYPTESQTRHQNLLRNLKSLLPIETLVIHGDKDQTVPWRSSSEFYVELKTLQLGSSARMRVFPGMGHEEPVVALMPTFGRNAPFRQPLMDEISLFIDGDNGTRTTRPESRRN